MLVWHNLWEELYLIMLAQARATRATILLLPRRGSVTVSHAAPFVTNIRAALRALFTGVAIIAAGGPLNLVLAESGLG